MRMRLIGGLILALCAMGADKSLPNQAGNAKLSLNGTAITDRKAITDLMGIDLGEGFIIVKIRATPQTLQPLRVSMDDFTLVSRKNGEKSGAMAPHAIAGSGAMIIGDARAQSGQGIGTRNNPSTMPTPVGGQPIGGMPTNGGGIGNTGSVQEGTSDARFERRAGEDPRLPYLEAKAFQDAESKEPIDGLLYFNLTGKLKPEQLGLIYAGPAGRLVIDFK
ncbi:MAG: hypothetical protein ABIR70_00330 [Bryobacteraceae bacterium]